MRNPDATSASGLRPAAAFVSVAAVLLAVGGKSAWIAFRTPGEQPDRWREVDLSPPADFELVDRAGRTLALSVECFDLAVSPHAMWRGHTPRHMAAALAELLEEDDEVILERLLPPPQPGQRQGVYRVQEPRLLRFDERAAGRVQRWLKSGATALHGGAGPIDGIELVRCGDGHYTLAIEPARLFDRDTRCVHLPEAADRPARWTRRLLDDLSGFVDLGEHATHPDLVALAGVDPRSRRVREVLADALWDELLPCRHRIVARRIDPLTAHALAELMEREAVSRFQLDLVAVSERRHPLRPGAQATHDLAQRSAGDAFPLLGGWGVLAPEEAWAQAQRELGVEPGTALGARERDWVERQRRALETTWRPWSGLERASFELLESPAWRGVIAERKRRYLHRERTAPRDRHDGWRAASPQGRLEIPDYFGARRAAAAPPRVVSTIDARLQQALYERLLGLMQEHDPALAMGIVVDVESGGVLAVDGVYAYPVSAFAPLSHSFTPGSTFKTVVMAAALEAGVVGPQDRFATYAGQGYAVPRSRRRIGEAEGAPTEAYVTATDGLAQSVNAVLVQIGLLVPAPRLREVIEGLGYGQRPDTGLGPASSGYLPPLERGTWSHAYTHASICFGHEIATTLWQHAAALATIARGGEWRPLRVIERVEQAGSAWAPAPSPARRVLSEAACDEVRAMLAEGARRGTGAAVAGPDHCPELDYVGTKTGTTEKTPGELCLHVELPHAVEHARIAAERPLDPAGHCSSGCKQRLRNQTAHRPGRQSCYTSSMLAIGRAAGRELLVLVVVEDSRSKARFGRDVAGRATMDLLRRGLGLPQRPLPAASEVPATSRGRAAFPLAAALNDRDLPWIEDVPVHAEQEAYHAR